MSYVNGLTVPSPHRSQYDSSSSSATRREGCGPATLANGANAVSSGRVSRTAQQVHDLIPRSQETDPSTLGWSLQDLDRAAAKLGVGFEVRSGQGWAAVVSALGQNLTVALQGDSDQFGNGTCSGAYDGPHVILVSPAFRVVNGIRQRWIDDPICPGGRWEDEYILHRYASKFASEIGFGVFTTPVPRAPVTAPPTVTLRYGGTKLAARQVKRIAVQAGRKANVRTRPTSAASVASRLANGATFTAYQVTKTGQLLAGSRTWFGDRTGTRWLHVTAF